MEYFDEDTIREIEIIDLRNSIASRLTPENDFLLPCYECPFAYEKLLLIERQLDGEDGDELTDETLPLICTCELPEGWENWLKDPEEDDDAWSMPDSWYE